MTDIKQEVVDIMDDFIQLSNVRKTVTDDFVPVVKGEFTINMETSADLNSVGGNEFVIKELQQQFTDKLTALLK